MSESSIFLIVGLMGGVGAGALAAMWLAARANRQMREQMREAFASLSRDALRDTNSTLLDTADHKPRERQDAIDALLKPVRETLDRVQSQMTAIDKAREGSFREVAQQLTHVTQGQAQLRDTTESLSRSLKSPNVRGRWGEVQLRRIVELAGMLEQCDFIEKAQVTTEGGARQTPDLIVTLPGNATIVVDAKVPIDGYMEAASAKDDGPREAGLDKHVRQVRDHIRTLGSKEYWKQFPHAPEFVVMFLPLEPLLQAAFERDASLLEQAASLRVIPATPMTLLALLKAASYGWKQQDLAQNAEEIQAIGRDLYERLAAMVEHLESIGSNIKQAANSYDRFVGSLETKVLPGARRFKELGVSSAKELEIPDQLSLSMRRVIKEELTGQPPSDDLVKIERLN